METIFRDRTDAGRQLARLLQRYAGQPETIVLALPRGGVPVAREVASLLRAPLDILVVRKLGVPGQPELAFGAIGPGGVCVLNEDVLNQLPDAQATIKAVTAQEEAELFRREHAYRGDAPALRLHGRTAILVDDGLATGATMRAAIAAARQLGAARIVAAAPVAARETCAELEFLADEVVCVTTPGAFQAVGQSYQNFRQTTDEEVRGILAETEHSSLRG